MWFAVAADDLSDASKAWLVANSTEIWTSTVSIAELVSNAHRRGLAHRTAAWLGMLRATARRVSASEEIMESAGAIHATERRRIPDLSLADAIILASARHVGAIVVTLERGMVGNRVGVKVKRLHRGEA